MAEIAVATSVYNLAGDWDDRPNVLKAYMVSVYAKSNRASLGRDIVSMYQGSPALSLKRFIKWAKTDQQFLSHIGLISGTLPGAPTGTEYFPAVPLRYNNTNIKSSAIPAAVDAFPRGYGGRYGDVMTRMYQNDNILDIDFCYATHGVSMNTRSNAGKKYLYFFLKQAMQTPGNYTQVQAQYFINNWGNPPSNRPPMPTLDIVIQNMRGGVLALRNTIRWHFLWEETGTGKLNYAKRAGDLWFTTDSEAIEGFPDHHLGQNQKVILNWQVTSTQWLQVHAIGLRSLVQVYAGNEVMITAIDAVTTNYRDSEFLIPLHEYLYNQMTTLDTMQLSTECNFLVFNCYAEHKKEWYESWWFKVITIVVIIAASVITALFTGGASLGAGGAAVIGVLTGAGLSTLAAIIIVASAQAIVGLLVSMLITEGAKAIFGQEWGTLIGAIVSVIFTLGTSISSVTEAVQSLAKPDVWMALACATGNGVASYMESESRRITEDTAKLMEDYGEKNAEIQRMYDEGRNQRGQVELYFVNQYISESTERPGDFIKRTLLTGADIAEITMKQIDDFVMSNLQLVPH